MRSLAVAAIVLASSAAHGESAMRIGMTFGVDRNAPEAREFGPQLAAGLRAGGFVGEVNYAYLSFADPDSSIHRFGVALRADLVRWRPPLCTTFRCTKSSALYGELGAAKRYGSWLVDEINSVYRTEPQSELSFAFGYELGRRYDPQDSGWQLGLRFSAARRDAELGTACRGTGCMISVPASSGVAESVMLEYMFMFGR